MEDNNLVLMRTQTSTCSHMGRVRYQIGNKDSKHVQVTKLSASHLQNLFKPLKHREVSSKSQQFQGTLPQAEPSVLHLV